MSLVVRTTVLGDDRPLLDLCPVNHPVAWLRGAEGLVGWGAAARIEPGPGEDRFLTADRHLQQLAARAHVENDVGLPGTGLVGLGSFSFDEQAGGSALVVPRVLVGRRDGTTWMTTIDAAGSRPAPPPRATPGAAPARDRPRYAGSSKPDVQWLEAVDAAIRRIGAGEADKVVLARDVAVWSHELFDHVDVARRLLARFPGCHTFVVDGLVGATPELLLALEGDRIESRVLAGTAGRSGDQAEDAALGAELLRSSKDQWEHVLAADSVLRVLSPRCVELTHDPAPRLLRLDNVQHLATTFRGTLRSPETSLELVGALHPTAAVGGTPRAQALAMIRELEGMDRGRYAGPVGWTTPDGDGQWGIALRCAQLEGARARLFAGVGVVAGSLPELELEETRLKLLAMQAVLGAD